ncbi:MAG: efflux RND transporter periplasmic adaptor subunit [Gammaproteobacteria bacterium]|nr:efflux RND transporter periplasmic adaptor subunit [Gammaproteobacteria bacterium]MDJ0870989.1 efflux RND transporter periplasmic adaptor subunit [Gammaproteobacteria bacterium]MDJ0889966.1 efflux RND transporter periplasmic adaptor subunit [Gammaproteobacteria bacterium]
MPNARAIQVFFFFSLAGLLTGCGKEPPPEPIRPVLAAKVGDVAGFKRDRFPGRAKAKDETNLSFRVFGPLISRPVDVGDRVTAGDIVAQIDPTDYEVSLENMNGRLDKARADRKFSEAEYQRVKNIFEDDPGAISKTALDKRKQELDANVAQVRTLTASVAQAELALGYTTLKAPFDGTIVATYAENFEFVKAQQPIVRLLDKSQIEMVIDVPEGLITLAQYVEKLVVVFDAYPDVELDATIVEIGREATEATRTFPVTLRMQPPEEVAILPGMAGVATGYARLPDDPAEGVKVPGHAVLYDQSGKVYVWVLKPETEPSKGGSATGVKAVAEKREVTVGKLTPYGIRVTSGLEQGAWIATAGMNTLRDGQEVFLQPTHGEKRS